MAWRDIKVKYKQTALGAGWAMLQPFLTMVVFSLLFGKLAKVPSDNIPYPIFAYAGLLDFLIASVILIAMMFFYHFTPSASGMILIPLVIGMIFIIAVGCGLWLSALNVE